MTRQHHILFLQGMASRFFGRLGDALKARGYRVHRINFNGGDFVFWPGGSSYAGTLAEWPAFLRRYLSERGITDIILFGDCRPLHRAAIAVAADHGIAVHVFEEGYMRPNWITLEPDGVNAHSTLSRDPEWIEQAAAGLPSWPPGVAVRNNMWRRAVEDIAYKLASQILAWRFPKYDSHRPWPWLVEYKNGARRFFAKRRGRHRLTETMDRLGRMGTPYFVFPLQLDADSQIRFHSQFGGIVQAIGFVVASFARSAPADATLIITEHPLDTSPFDWRSIVAACAGTAGIADRVQFFEQGSPERLLQECRGVVTVNSTLGYLALSFGKPVIALGAAIYNLPRLTFQGGLDAFWKNPQAPDAALFDAFRRVLGTHSQINGAFFSRAGLKLAVSGAVTRLEVQMATYAPAIRIAKDEAPTQLHAQPAFETAN